MFVKNHSIPANKVATLREGDSLKTALRVMEEHGHDALPVLSGNKLLGILSKQYLYKKFFLDPTDKESYILGTSVGQLMKTNFRYVYEQDLIEAAIKQMTTMRMQFIAVYNSQDQFAGILTRRALLEAMGNALGIDKKGVRVEIVVNNIEGRLAALTKLLAKADYNIISILMLDPELMNLQKIIMRIDTREEKHLTELITAGGFNVLTSILE